MSVAAQVECQWNLLWLPATDRDSTLRPTGTRRPGRPAADHPLRRADGAPRAPGQYGRPTTRQCQWHAQPASASVSWSQDDPASDLLTRPGLGQGGGVDEGSFPVWALARLAWARAVVGEVLVGGPLGQMPRQG